MDGPRRDRSQHPSTIWHRQGPQHQCIEQAENGRVHADPERQGQNCDSGEPGMRPQLTQSILQVLPDRLRRNNGCKHSLGHAQYTT